MAVRIKYQGIESATVALGYNLEVHVIWSMEMILITVQSAFNMRDIKIILQKIILRIIAALAFGLNDGLENSLMCY